MAITILLSVTLTAVVALLAIQRVWSATTIKDRT